MRQRLSLRLARNKRLAPKQHRAVSNDPPAQADGTVKVRTAVRQLRQTARGDPATLEICDEAEKLIASGWTVRRGGPDEPKRAKLLPEWGGKEPPERP